MISHILSPFPNQFVNWRFISLLYKMNLQQKTAGHVQVHVYFISLSQNSGTFKFHLLKLVRTNLNYRMNDLTSRHFLQFYVSSYAHINSMTEMLDFICAGAVDLRETRGKQKNR